MTKILIVDDEQDARESIAGYLSRSLECEVSQADNGEMALDLINTTAFDLVILDIHLPGMSGIDILNKTQYKQLDFLIISGYDSVSIAERALQEGAADYITKPFTIAVLAEKVKIILSRKNLYFPK